MPTCGSGVSPRVGAFQNRIWKTLHREWVGTTGLVSSRKRKEGSSVT
jgi:hypothetical protein